MARLSPTKETIRTLFARSGNECAFPECQHELINKKDQFVAQICHIKAAESGGERYDTNQTDEERRAANNLLLLCYRHHIETNDVNEFTIEKMEQIKRNHEEQFSGSGFRPKEEIIDRISAESTAYWGRIDRLNTIEHSLLEFALPIEARHDAFQLLADCRENIDIIESFIDHLCESVGSRREFWEACNLGLPNRMELLQVQLRQLELKLLEYHVREKPDDKGAMASLESLRKEFEEIAQHAVVRD